jgi:succinyl-diaminopimelate desuccinylase
MPTSLPLIAMSMNQSFLSEEKSLLRAVTELVAIPSTLHNLAELQNALDFIAEMIWNTRPDITIERFESNGKPSLLAYRGRTRPDKFHIILNGHLDVVPGTPEQYKTVVRGGKLYGRGVYDMKAACVVLTSVFCEFVDRVPYALGLQIVTDEENASKDGTAYQIKQGVRADFVICGECGRSPSSYEIANEAKGFVMTEIGFHGKSAHSAYPWEGDNAILQANRFIQAVHEIYPAPTEEYPGTLVSVTSISSDSGAHSKIPDYAEVRLVFRYTADDANFTTKRRFREFIKDIDPDATIVSINDFTSPFYTSPNNELLIKLRESAETIEGTDFKLVRRHGTGDGRFYGDVNNEACEFGIAGRGAHSDNEYITLAGFRNYLQTMRLFLEKTQVNEALEQKLAALGIYG